jgi:3-oxoacid CoA-transferase subunit A
VPQGTLAEWLRAGGAGIPTFYTATGVGTSVAEGKTTARFDGLDYLLERAILPDLTLVRAWRADAEGNLAYRLTARNLNPLTAAAGKVTVANAEEVVDGFLAPDSWSPPVCSCTAWWPPCRGPRTSRSSPCAPGPPGRARKGHPHGVDA